MPKFEVELKYDLSDSTLTVQRVIDCGSASGAVEAAQVMIGKELDIGIQPRWVHVYKRPGDPGFQTSVS